jgi:hypothetical protein
MPGLRAGGSGDGRERVATRAAGAGVAVTEEFLGGKPVLKVAPLGLTLFNPKQIGGMLNLRLGGLMQRNGFAIHGTGWVGV